MRNLVLAVAASGIIRNAHYLVPNGKTIPERTLLLERESTNYLSDPDQFNGAAWIQTNISVTPNAAIAPDGTLTADKVAATATAVAGLVQTVTTIASTAVAYSVRGRIGSGAADARDFLVYNATTAQVLLWVTIDWTTGVLSVVSGSGTSRSRDLGALWWEIALGVTTGITSGDDITVYAGFPNSASTAGEHCYLWRAQLEPLPYATSPIVGASRVADALYLPHTLAPQAGTLYVRFIELGMASYGSNEGVVSLGSSTNPSVMVLTGGGGGYYAVNRQSADQASGGPAGTPAIGDLVELRLVIAADGALTLGQSINGGTETVGTASAAQPLPAAWNVPRIYVGSRGAGTEGNYAFTHGPVFVAGTQTLTTMRQVAGVR